ncbi:MAG: hypothetical protein KDJ41_02080 [Hyphomicrobiaceae bacterium]|nr:hypothetical protein [Hyphomicrobiaceae bacterium]
MQLIERLTKQAEGADGVFRQQLAREDLERLGRLEALAGTTGDHEAFTKAALLLGWTPGDLRTSELLPALGPLVEALHRWYRGKAGPDDDAVILRLWAAFDDLRIARLVGCLSRVPWPARG